VFLGDLRISTNVRTADGARAVGTRLSAPVCEEVLDRGGTWSAPAFVVNDWYITAYKPIRDPAGRIIGALYVGLLQAPYGTRLYERMLREDRLRSELSGDNVDGSTNLVPLMGLDVLREGYRWLLDQIYSPRLYYARARTFLREYRAPKVSMGLEPDYLIAFFRSIYQLGIRGQEREQYWALLFWTLGRRPKLFPVAVTLAISGYHFRLVAESRVQ
jgi:hypothetical protein